MDKSEPALVPEWLRSSGSVAGGGNSAHHFAAPSTHIDASCVSHHTRNRSSKTTSDFDSPRSVFLERTFSTNSRRSINGSAKHAYSSFNRSHRDKDRDREKDRTNFVDHWDRDCSEPLSDLFPGRIERDTIRRSHSMVSRKQNELLNHRVAVDTKSGGNSNQNSSNDLLSGNSIGSSIQKAVFNKDFPSLGAEERQGITEIGRVSSPGLGVTASQTLPVGSSALIGGEGWTSALAEVPAIIANSSTGSLTLQQTVAPTSGSVHTTTSSSSLNMAEALAQTPSRARSTPQLSVKTQRLEELAIKQSRQLIPVTPSMPKALVNNSSEKSKPKTAVRNTEINMAGKSLPQQPLHIVNHSVRSGNAKGDAPKTSGKFTDLKSVVWENGVSLAHKDPSSQSNYSNNRPGNHIAVASAVASTPLRNPNNLKSPTERKPASLDLKLGSTMDKKHSISQMQSRNDFFNLIKKKTLMNSSSATDSSPVVSSPTMDISGEVNSAVGSPASPHGLGNGAEMTSNGIAHVEINRTDYDEKDTLPDEEEAAFLRSLGWEENSGEDGGHTEEEINAFYQECMKLGTTTLKLCQGMQPKLSKDFESYATNLHGASSELSSSDSRSEA
ncbi:hypothetical protein Fmac_007781 [Flemingia macrophylla]|uniref:Mediator of RNA polymerase II transcription subunit 1 n=1 Tax=Flemingia macrophylla TaxID=520843 RepID=A0ABD1MW14_9FABA